MNTIGEAPLYRPKTPPVGRIVDDILAGIGNTAPTATTLPPAAYTSQEFFELEVEKIFMKDWLGVGHLSQVPRVGDYFTIDLFGEPLVVVRGKDRVRVLSRVCLHRWVPVVSGEGNTQVFRCPFHRWGYALDGQLIATPFMEKAENFDPSACRLPEVKTEIIDELGLIFISFDPDIGPLRPRIADLIEHLAPYKLSELVGVDFKRIDQKFNWKIQIETGQESYHHFGTHPMTFEMTHPSRLSWCETGREAWTGYHSPMRPTLPPEAAGMGLPLFSDLTPDALRSLNIYHIFPLTRLIALPDHVRLKCVIPAGPMRTRATFISLVRPEAAAQPELIQQCLDKSSEFFTKAATEDNDMDEAQQLGVISRHARAGRLSHLEGNVWDLARYIRSKLAVG